MRWKLIIILSLIFSALIIGGIYLFNNPKMVYSIFEKQNLINGKLYNSEVQSSPTSSRGTGIYELINQDGNESLYNVKIEKQIDGTSNICAIANFSIKTVKLIDGKASDSKGVISADNYDYKVPDTIKITTDDAISILTKEIIDKDGKIKFDGKFDEAKGDKQEFCYNANPENDFYIKIGESSIVVIQLMSFNNNFIGVNVTAELSNISHLKISKQEPYNNLKGYWNFDSDVINKTAYDWADDEKDGTYIGNVIVDYGIYNNSGVFNGVNGYINVPSFNITNNTMTITAWIYMPKNCTNYQCGIIGKRNGTTTGFHFDVKGDLSAPARKLIFGEGNVGSLVGNTVMDLNKWYQVAVTTNSGNVTLYVNGVIDNNGLIGWTSSQSNLNLNIGKVYSSINVDQLFNGSIDEIMIFNSTLNSSQILSIYNNQSPRFYPQGTQEIAQFNVIDGTNRVNVSLDNNLNEHGTNLSLRLGMWDISKGYDTSLMPDNLTAYYSFDNQSSLGENGSSIVDKTGVNNITVINGTDFDSSGAYYLGKAFNGINDSLVIGRSSSMVSGYVTKYLTWIFWIKRNSMGIVEGILNDGSNSTGYGYSITIGNKTSNDNKIHLSGRGYGEIASNGQIGTNWTFVKIEFQNGRSNIYINNKLDKTSTAITVLADPNGNGIYVGRAETRDGATYYLNGSLDELMMFNTNITNNKTTELYVKGLAIWNYTQYQSINLQDVNYTYEISKSTTNVLPSFKLSSDINNFFSPIINGNINIEYYNVSEAQAIPKQTLDINFTYPTPNNASSQTGTSIYINISSNSSNNHYTFTDFDRTLLLWYRMDDYNGSTITDLSSYSNNGTNLSGGIYDSSGVFNASWKFDGINDWIIVNKNITDLFEFSISNWMNITNKSLTQVPISGGNNQYVHTPLVNSLYDSFINSSGAQKTCIVTNVWELGNWSMYTTTVKTQGSDTNVTVYKNGVIKNSCIIANGIVGFNVSQIGKSKDLGLYFNGSLDEVFVFNRSLSTQEVLSLYNATAYQYSNNFNGLNIGNHTFTGYAVDTIGNRNQTEQRTVNIKSTNSIGITYPYSYFIAQRHNSTTGQIPIYVNYTGSPTAISARFMNGEWFNISVNPAGGAANGWLNATTGSGTLEVKFSDNPSINFSVQQIGVGDIFVAYGQSNSIGWGANPQQYNTSNIYNASKFNSTAQQWQLDNDPTSVGGTGGSPYPLLLSFLVRNQSVPIGIISHGSVNEIIALTYKTTNYNNLKTDILRATNNTMRVKGMLYLQGEQDTRNDSIVNGSYINYLNNLTYLVNGFANDTYGAPTVVAQIGGYSYTQYNTRDRLDNIRQVQMDAWNLGGNFTNAGAILYDIAHDADTAHFNTNAELQGLADRWSASILHSFYNSSEFIPPKIINITIPAINSSNFTININGTQLIIENWNASNISSKAYGFRINDNNTIYTDSDIISTTLNNSSLLVVLNAYISNNSLISFASGDDAIKKPVVRDNSTFKLPLQPFYNKSMTITENLNATNATAKECGAIPFDNCYVNQNTEFNQDIYDFNGTIGKGVIIINKSDVILNCNGSTLQGNWTGQNELSYAIYFANQSNVTIKNCIINNYKVGINQIGNNSYNIINNTLQIIYFGIDTEKTFYANISKNRFYNQSYYSIDAGNWFKNVIIDDNVFKNNSYRIIRISGNKSSNENINITNNNFTNPKGNQYSFNEITMKNSRIINNYGEGSGLFSGVFELYGSENIEIKDNIIRYSQYPLLIDSNSINITVSNNKLKENDIGMSVGGNSTNIKIRDNIFLNNTLNYDGYNLNIHVNNASNIIIENNNFSEIGTGGIMIRSQVKDVIIRNNSYMFVNDTQISNYSYGDGYESRFAIKLGQMYKTYYSRGFGENINIDGNVSNVTIYNEIFREYTPVYLWLEGANNINFTTNYGYWYKAFKFPEIIGKHEYYIANNYTTITTKVSGSTTSNYEELGIDGVMQIKYSFRKDLGYDYYENLNSTKDYIEIVYNLTKPMMSFDNGTNTYYNRSGEFNFTLSSLERVWIYDNYNDTLAPNITNLMTNPASPMVYNPLLKVKLNSTVTDETEVGTVILIFNGINYTSSANGNIYNTTIPIQSAGTYNYYWWANDTNGNNRNVSGTFIITKNTSIVYTYINGTRSNRGFANGTEVNITGTLINGVGNLNLSVNGTMWSYGVSPLINISTFIIGTYDINISNTGNINYTEASERWILTITTPSIPSNVTSVVTSIRTCKWKKFGYYNTKLPFLREENCV